jgi:hypothetical protein
MPYFWLPDFGESPQKHFDGLLMVENTLYSNKTYAKKLMKILDRGQFRESKPCPVCNRAFSNRKKWKNNFDTVIYCSDRCRKNKSKNHSPNEHALGEVKS